MKYFVFVSFLFLMACNNTAPTQAETTVEDSTMQVSTSALDTLLVANAKDPICGMPVKNHVSDTATYDGKLMGFCATECKEEFLKGPKTHIAAAEIK